MDALYILPNSATAVKLDGSVIRVYKRIYNKLKRLEIANFYNKRICEDRDRLCIKNHDVVICEATRPSRSHRNSDGL